MIEPLKKKETDNSELCPRPLGESSYSNQYCKKISPQAVLVFSYKTKGASPCLNLFESYDPSPNFGDWKRMNVLSSCFACLIEQTNLGLVVNARCESKTKVVEASLLQKLKNLFILQT